LNLFFFVINIWIKALLASIIYWRIRNWA